MKNTVFTSTFKKAGLVAIMALVLGITTEAQTSDKIVLKDLAVKNIVANISNESEGIRRMEIYLAAICNVSEAVDALSDQLKDEEIPRNRILIAWALYKIGDPEGIKAIYKAAAFDKDTKVRRMCYAYYNEYEKTKQVLAVSEGKM